MRTSHCTYTVLAYNGPACRRAEGVGPGRYAHPPTRKVKVYPDRPGSATNHSLCRYTISEFRRRRCNTTIWQSPGGMVRVGNGACGCSPSNVVLHGTSVDSWWSILVGIRPTCVTIARRRTVLDISLLKFSNCRTACIPSSRRL